MNKINDFKSLLTGFFIGLGIWVLSSIYDYVLFYDEFITSLFMPHLSDLYYRLTIVFITSLSGYFIGRYQLKTKRLQLKLESEKRQREDAEYSLKTETVIDEDSGLYTQSAVIKFLEHEINQFQRFKTDLSVVLLEIDGLPAYLKNQPESEVDKLKLEISQLVKNTIRSSDMAGHWGNNNYILATVKTNEQQAHLVEDKIQKNMANLINKYDDKLRVITGLTHLDEDDSAMDFLNKIASSSVAA